MLSRHDHPRAGESTGIILRDVDPAEIRAALDAGQTLMLVGRRKPAPSCCRES